MGMVLAMGYMSDWDRVQSEGFPAACCGVTIFPRPLRERGIRPHSADTRLLAGGEVHCFNISLPPVFYLRRGFDIYRGSLC